GAFSWYSEITPAGGPVSSRRAILARQVSARPNSTTAETVRRPRNSMFSARTCHIEPRGETVSGTTTRMSEFFRVELLPDLTDLRLAGFEVLRGVAELHDRPERRDALLVVVLRFLQRVLPLVAGEQRGAPSTKLSAPHVRVSDERAVAARERVAPRHGRVERLERAVDVGEQVQLRDRHAHIGIEGGRIRRGRVAEADDRALRHRAAWRP